VVVTETRVRVSLTRTDWLPDSLQVGHLCGPLSHRRLRRMLGARRRGSSGGADLVDEPVVERFPGVEVAPAPHVFGDLLGGPARELGKASVEPPE
jgi:hypothetical protein